MSARCNAAGMSGLQSRSGALIFPVWRYCRISRVICARDSLVILAAVAHQTLVRPRQVEIVQPDQEPAGRHQASLRLVSWKSTNVGASHEFADHGGLHPSKSSFMIILQ